MPVPSPDIPKPPPNPVPSWPVCVVEYDEGQDGAMTAHAEVNGKAVGILTWSYSRLWDWANEHQLRLVFASSNNGAVDS